MKITVDLRMFYSSGIGTYLQNLLPRLIALRKKDNFSLLFNPGKKPIGLWTTAANLQWVECTSPIYSLTQQRELLRKIPSGTDLLWIPHFDIPIFYSGKMMVTVHDVFQLAMPQLMGGRLKHIYARWMFGQMNRKSSSICAVSEFTKGELVRLTGSDPEKIKVTSLGVDPSWFHIFRQKNPYSRPFLLYVGNIKPHKNLKRLLEAFGKIQNQIPHDLILVGKKDGFITGDGEVHEKAREFGSRVVFTGLVSDDELKQYFVHAEELVFPSLYEGFGLPALEAMACGCPVAASHAASIPEVCGKAVSYFDPLDSKDIAEKILKMIQDKKFRKNLKQRGLKRARVFSWEKTAKETNQVIDRILA